MRRTKGRRGGRTVAKGCCHRRRCHACRRSPFESTGLSGDDGRRILRVGNGDSDGDGDGDGDGVATATATAMVWRQEKNKLNLAESFSFSL